MSESFDIQREEADGRGRYVIHMPDGSEAELTYGRPGDQTLVADHTGVPPQFRGQGIAEALVARLMADARDAGEKIVPVCSYVAVQFRRHPEWADLKA